MVAVIDILRTTCGPSCQSMANCWQHGISKVHREGCKDPEQETAAFINGNLQNMANMFGSPNVIKANNPEVQVTMGENTMLVCDLEIDNLEGDDWEVSWYKMKPNGVWDPDTIMLSERYELALDHLSLSIKGVSYEDRGIYRCEAINTKNSYRPGEAEFNVIVIPRDSVDGKIRVRIDQTPIACREGQRVNMVAVIENRPKKVKLEWFKMKGAQEVPLNKRRIKTSHSKVHTALKIKSASVEDGGVYRVKVTSPGEICIGHVIVNVNTHNCDIEIEEMMKRAFDTIDTEGTGLLTPSQVRESLLNLGLTVPKNNIDDLIYEAADETGTLVHYFQFIEMVIDQYQEVQ